MASYAAKSTKGDMQHNLLLASLLGMFDGGWNNFFSVAMSFDTIAHEAGHGVLHSLRPTFFNPPNNQTRAFHESFGDITGILTQISQLDVCEKIIVFSKVSS